MTSADAGGVSIHLPTRLAAADVPWTELAGFRVGLVLWVGLAVTDVGRALGATEYAELAAIAVLVTLSSVGTRPSTGLYAAATGWLVVDGFVEHRYGLIAYDVPRDTAILLLLAILALAAARTGRTR